ncbi:MAG: transglutaminase-like domain-containing protein [Candidatus Bathyarchaeia archaeon]
MVGLNKKIKALLVIAVVAIALAVTSFIFQEPMAHYFFVTGNQNTMKNIVNEEQLRLVKDSLEEYFGGTKNLTLQDLFTWQNKHLRYVDSFPWFGLGRPSADPKAIMNAGIGRCGEYSILFTAACIAVGYQARIVTVVKTDFLSGVHQFCQVKLNGTWILVDSSCYAPDKLVINDTSVYTNWGWWPLQEKGYYAFSFDENNAYNITDTFVKF